LFIRLPLAASPLGIAAAAMAYVSVDLYLGSSVLHTALLNSGNMVSVLTSFLAWSVLAKRGLFPAMPDGALGLILASAVGSAAAGLVGAPTEWILFGGGYWRGWSYWFATEFNNYMVFLPALVTVPVLPVKTVFKALPQLRLRLVDALPAVAVLVSVIASTMVGGPGALAFPIPALLWAALSYSVFPVAALVMLFSLWLGFAIFAGGFLSIDPMDQDALVSLRLGISLIALFPVVLSYVMKSRNQLLARLEHMATYDPMTDALNSRAFRERAAIVLEGDDGEIAVFALDIDHFKQINDRDGHAAGDMALINFAHRVRQVLRPEDVFGRIGGEEFAILAPRCTADQAAAIAERVREAIKAPVDLGGGGFLRMTVSIGLTVRPGDQPSSIDDLLKTADRLLYQAKHNGRDRVETGPED
jgi:diguanylate cyclase (GGDEF)-like protein